MENEKNEWRPFIGRTARLRRNKKSVFITNQRCDAGNMTIYTVTGAGTTYEVYASELLPPEDYKPRAS